MSHWSFVTRCRPLLPVVALQVGSRDPNKAPGTSKWKKAESLGTRVMTEEEFLLEVDRLTGQKQGYDLP